MTEENLSHRRTGENLIGLRRGKSFEQHPATTTDCRDVGQVSIDVLPDDVLLETFYYYREQGGGTEAWIRLVHTCRKWRNIVFVSPRRLNLQLICTARKPVREKLYIWPPLPIVISSSVFPRSGMDNIIAALEHNDRIHQVKLYNFPSSLMEQMLAAMQKPFPSLARLWLELREETVPIIPDSFLGGFAPLPLLQLFRLSHIPFPFPGFRKLLLSAPNLVRLELYHIPHSGYIPPEAMVTCLSALTRLESLFLGLQSPRSHPAPGGRRPSQRSLTVLPSLSWLWLKGASEYVEDIISRIDAPLLDYLSITFFHRLIFDTPQLAQFIGRTPKFKTLNEANIFFDSSSVIFSLTEIVDSTSGLEFRVLCGQPDWELSALSQVCATSLPQALIPTVERLYILESSQAELSWQVDIENGQWLELLRSFAAVKGFYLCKKFAPRIAPTLQELVGESVSEVLPTLQSLFLEELHSSGPVQEGFDQFVTARRLACYPIAVSSWVRMM